MSPTDPTDRPCVIPWPPLIFLGCAGVGSLLHFIVPLPVMGYPVCLCLGVFLAAVCLSVGIWAERVMKAAGTNVRPDRPTLAIVKSGPYRFTRNPMYLALCVLQVALGLVLNDWIPIMFVVPLALLLHFGIIPREEKYLERKFGEPYLQFKRQVRRWI